MHPEQRALLDGIIANPEDNVRRGAYADWLDEHEEGDICPHCNGDGEEEHTIYCDGDYKIDVRECSHCKGTGGTSNKFAKRAAFIRGQLQDPQSSRTVSKHVVEVVWRRGFIAEVRCTMVDWERYGSDACRNHAVERVVITDKEPHLAGLIVSTGECVYSWNFGNETAELGAYVLPEYLNSIAIEQIFSSVDEARDWLSRRCIETARAKIDALQIAANQCD